MHSTLNFLACNVDWHIGLSFILFCLSFVQLAKGRERGKKKVDSIAYLSSVKAWPFLVVFLFLSFFLFFFLPLSDLQKCECMGQHNVPLLHAPFSHIVFDAVETNGAVGDEAVTEQSLPFFFFLSRTQQ